MFAVRLEGIRRGGQIKDSQTGMIDGVRLWRRWGGGDGENIESTVITERQIQLFIVKQRHSSAHHTELRKHQGSGREACGYPCRG